MKKVLVGIITLLVASLCTTAFATIGSVDNDTATTEETAVVKPIRERLQTPDKCKNDPQVRERDRDCLVNQEVLVDDNENECQVRDRIREQVWNCEECSIALQIRQRDMEQPRFCDTCNNKFQNRERARNGQSQEGPQENGLQEQTQIKQQLKAGNNK